MLVDKRFKKEAHFDEDGETFIIENGKSRIDSRYSDLI